jgi:hypothetical protein
MTGRQGVFPAPYAPDPTSCVPRGRRKTCVFVDCSIYPICLLILTMDFSVCLTGHTNFYWISDKGPRLPHYYGLALAGPFYEISLKILQDLLRSSMCIL